MEDGLGVRGIRDDELASLPELYTHLNAVDDPLPGKGQLEQTWKEIQSDPRHTVNTGAGESVPA